MKTTFRLKGFGTGLVLALGLMPGASPAQEASYPAPLSSSLPYDVDLAALKALDRDTQVPEAQRIFDIFAWQTFVALNWPAGPGGRPATGKTMADNTSPRVWAALHEGS